MQLFHWNIDRKFYFNMHAELKWLFNTWRGEADGDEITNLHIVHKRDILDFDMSGFTCS